MKNRPTREKENLYHVFGKDTGFTLVEVLITLVIVSIGLLGIAGLQTRAIGVNHAARMQTEATALAAGLLEQVRLLPFDHPDLVSGSEPRLLAASSSSPFEVQWAVIDDQPVTGTKTVRIRVSWPTAAYGSVVRMQTVMARQGRW